jgi:hypothetical protein
MQIDQIEWERQKKINDWRYTGNRTSRSVDDLVEAANVIGEVAQQLLTWQETERVREIKIGLRHEMYGRALRGKVTSTGDFRLYSEAVSLRLIRTAGKIG